VLFAWSWECFCQVATARDPAWRPAAPRWAELPNILRDVVQRNAYHFATWNQTEKVGSVHFYEKLHKMPFQATVLHAEEYI
jgi:hypothetical protein